MIQLAHKCWKQGDCGNAGELCVYLQQIDTEIHMKKNEELIV